MNELERRLLAGLLCAAASAPVAAAAVSSTFDTDADGWTVTSFADTSSIFTSPPLATGIAPSFNAAGGDPGGFISVLDPDDGWTYFVAPLPYLGDQSDKLGGALVFSLQQHINGGTIIATPGTVALRSGSLVLVHQAGAVPASAPDWTSYGVALDAVHWRIAGTGAVATDAELAQTLAALDGLFISAEFVTPVVEKTGLDSVSFVAPVPLPAAVWGLASALGVLGLRRRRA
ncbi:MAG TPA: laminin B domain-containing protein [Gammaproteobacteria bacterium]|nr:laminin B domain-containing protein [Gammaproteobacteria bacterium]